MPVNPGEVIGSCDCPSCGNDTPLKISKNRTVYVICTNVIDQKPDGTKERCGYRTFWGRVKSREMIKQFEEIQHDQPENRTETETDIATDPVGADELAGTTIEPEPIPESAPAKRSRFSTLFD